MTPQQYDPASVRLTFNGRQVSTHDADATPRGTEMLRTRHTGAASLRGVVDEFTFNEAMRRIGLTLLNAPRRVVTAEDVARVERATAKRARKAAARRPSC